MNELDKKLYYIFKDIEVEVALGGSWTESEIANEAPQLHDVFKLSRGKGWKCEILDAESIGYKDVLVINSVGIEYNPTLPLLMQSDETKSQLISLFS